MGIGGLVAGIPLLVSLKLASCTPAGPCFVGISPGDGATAVATDLAVVLTGPALPRDVAALGELAQLELLPEETPIDVVVTANRQGGTVTLRPVEPLLPNRWYRAWGYDVGTLDSVHYWSSQLDQEWDSTTIEFYTGSAPQLLLGVAADESVRLVFSEAMDLTSLTDTAVQFVLDSDDGSEPVPWSAVSPDPDDPRVLHFDFPDPEVIPDAAIVSPEARAATGVAFDGDGDGVVGETEDEQRIEINTEDFYSREGDLVRVLGVGGCYED